jgi:hypothetical protein
MQTHYIMKVKALHNENQNKLWDIYYRIIIKNSGGYFKTSFRIFWGWDLWNLLHFFNTLMVVILRFFKNLHYAKMWFLWLGHVATIAQNSHVVVSGLDS